jgi:hypothetical protein
MSAISPNRLSMEGHGSNKTKLESKKDLEKSWSNHYVRTQASSFKWWLEARGSKRVKINDPNQMGWNQATTFERRTYMPFEQNEYLRGIVRLHKDKRSTTQIQSRDKNDWFYVCLRLKRQVVFKRVSTRGYLYMSISVWWDVALTKLDIFMLTHRQYINKSIIRSNGSTKS